MSSLRSCCCCFKRNGNKNRVAPNHNNNDTTVTTKDGESTFISTSQHEYYDFLAPSVYHLQTTFLDNMKENGLDPSSTFYQIENLQSTKPGLIRKKGQSVPCPIDHRMGASYVHCLDEGSKDGNDHVGSATHMLSYAWSYKYQDVVDALVQYCHSRDLDVKRTYVWICAFCTNLHRVVEQDGGDDKKHANVSFEEFRHVFQKRIRGIGHILAMMTPWNDPQYLKRIWCIFEMYSAYTDPHTKFQIIMPPGQKDSLINTVMNKTADETRNGTTLKNGLCSLFGCLTSIKVENALASNQLDKDHILQMIENGPGCARLNAEINVLLKHWVRDTILLAANDIQEKWDNTAGGEEGDYSHGDTAAFLTFCASFFSRCGAHQEAIDLHTKGLKIYETMAKGDGTIPSTLLKELTARCYNDLGTQYGALGKYYEALAQHDKCREVFEQIHGKDHESTVSSYINIAGILSQIGRAEEALGWYQKALHIDKHIKGESHIDVALSLSNIGRIKQQNGDYDGALESFTESLQIREDAHGKNRPHVAIGYGDIGLLHHMRGEYKQAIEYHSKAMEIQEQILGSTFQNLGASYFEEGMYNEALEYHARAHDAKVIAFGPDHPKTKTAMDWIGIVQDAMETRSDED